jgi:tetratricopeptide (TPR) repeat protein
MTGMIEITKVALRPQPLGVFPFPAGLMLLPDAGEPGRMALAGLMRGDAEVALPEEWLFFKLAMEGDLAGALAAIDRDDGIAIHNRIALGEDLPASGDLAVLHRAVRYAVGREDLPPDPEGLDAELLAFVLMLHSTYAIEHDQLERAIDPLQRAIAAARNVSPEFAAQLIGQLAALESDRPSVAIQHYREALSLASGHAKAELSLQLGIALQGSAQGDELRIGAAVQALREALKVYTKDAYPKQWASAQLNLANALQSLPNSHREENLMEAVAIYDEILSVRNRALDPVGYARLLANQANALAHLGRFAPAMEKIGEAYKLFQRHNEPEMAASAMNLLESIREQRDPR